MTNIRFESGTPHVLVCLGFNQIDQHHLINLFPLALFQACNPSEYLGRASLEGPPVGNPKTQPF